jgi:hypothetical protein
VEATCQLLAPGHQLHTVDVDDDMGTIRDLDEYQQRLSSHDVDEALERMRQTLIAQQSPVCPR